MFTRKRGIAVVAAISVLLLGPASVAQAQDGPTEGCSGDVVGVWPGAGFGGGGVAGLFAGPPHRTTQRTIASALPAGTYVVNAVSYDGSVGRASNPAQVVEQYFLEFLDAGGNVLATSAATVDLQDGVDEASWAGSLGEVTLASDAVAVRATHLFAGQVLPIPTQSVMPSCFGATALVVQTTTTTLTTTTPTTTTTTVVVSPPTSVTTPPTTSSTVVTQVLPEVEEMPAPNPVVATPRFTG
jgi:hypothetical protein